jgi:hypothetical protein
VYAEQERKMYADYFKMKIGIFYEGPLLLVSLRHQGIKSSLGYPQSEAQEASFGGLAFSARGIRELPEFSLQVHYAIFDSVETGLNLYVLTRTTKILLYTIDSRFRASPEARRGRDFFLNFLVIDSPRGRPFGGGGIHPTRWIE